MMCAVCGRPIRGAGVPGGWWVWVHVEGGHPTPYHHAQPAKAPT